MKRLKKVEEHIEHATWNAANAPKQIRTLEVEQQQRLTHKMSMKWHEDYRIEMQNISAYLLRAIKILTNLVLQVRWRYSNREETKSILQSIVHSAESNHHSYGAHAYPFPRLHETTGREGGRKEIFKIFQNSSIRFHPIFPFDQGSIDSQLDVISMHGSRLDSERKPSLTRSQTDSNITYASDEIPEAPGSCCYITKEGDIDLQVVLKVGFRSIVLIEFFLWNCVLKLSFFIRQFTRSLCGTVIVVL